MGRRIKKGSTDQSTVIRIVDSTAFTPETGVEHNTSGIDLWYRREGATKTSITEAALASLDAAHSDGGIEHIGDGYYRLDLPDAACATGANSVQIGGTVTGMIVIGNEHELCDIDPYDGVRMGMIALPNAAADAAGGLPISDAGGLDLDDLKADVTAILADTGTDGVVLAADAITAAKIADDAISAEHINTGALTADAFAADALVAATFATDCITDDAIATGAIASTAFAAGAINAAAIADGAIDNATFAADVGSTAYATNIIALAAKKAVDEYDPPTGAELAATEAKVDTIDTVVDAIKAKTDNLPADPADDGDIDTQLAAIAAYIDTEVATLVSELAKVPKSDSNVTWNATALASINAEVDTALNTAIPAAPTAGSINAYIQQVKFVIKNKMEITEADGATVVYKDDGTTPYCSVAAAFSSDSTTTTRKALA